MFKLMNKKKMHFYSEHFAYLNLCDFLQKFEKGEAHAIRVFRGENLGNRKIDSGYRCDWQLVPKEEEAAILKKAETCKPREKTSVEPIGKIPPLMDLLLRNEMKAAGQDASKPLIYRKKISQSFTNTAVLEHVENH